MMIDQPELTAADLLRQSLRLFELAQSKSADRQVLGPSRGTPVFTVEGKYTAARLDRMDAGLPVRLRDPRLRRDRRSRTARARPANGRRSAWRRTSRTSACTITASTTSRTYGNLRRLMREGRIPHNEWEHGLLRAGAQGQRRRAGGALVGVPVPSRHRRAPARQASATSTRFNGPHSLFVDTMRTIRILGVAWQLGHMLDARERPRRPICSSGRSCTGWHQPIHRLPRRQRAHLRRPRPNGHEAIFNRNDGTFRCRSTQQGYSPFSTWTRGLAWAMLGFAEELEFFATIPDAEFEASVDAGQEATLQAYSSRPATTTCDHYIDDCAAADGIVYWDDGAPGLAKMGDWRSRDADPFNDLEPVDSSASAIAAQGLLRLGRYLDTGGKQLHATPA